MQGNTRGTSFGLVRCQYSAPSFMNLVQRFEYAGFGSGFGLSLCLCWDGRILGGLIISSQSIVASRLKIQFEFAEALAYTEQACHMTGSKSAVASPYPRVAVIKRPRRFVEAIFCPQHFGT